MTIQLFGVHSFGAYHGTIACIGVSQIGYRIVVIPVPPSRNLVGSFGHGILWSMPRVTRSTPTSTPPAGAVPTVGTAPDARPQPKPGFGLIRGAADSSRGRLRSRRRPWPRPTLTQAGRWPFSWSRTPLAALVV